MNDHVLKLCPDEELLEDALRFKDLTFAFGDAVLTAGTSFSSSASLSELLHEEESEGTCRVTFATGASFISTSLSSSLLLSPNSD